ncbi:hypothetical protein V6N13_149266 [Hibiscus sabdariffa]|uniref:Uncharacterized protein n=1 Tax=Hibiscus sabdariffa TaxID=183260 RepID=A0ABR2EHV1_9ROSI
MPLFKYNGEWLQERRGGLIGSILNLVVARGEQGSRIGRRGRRLKMPYLKDGKKISRDDKGKSPNATTSLPKPPNNLAMRE